MQYTAPSVDDRRTELYVRQYGSPSTDAVVLLHGHSQSGRMWASIAARLAESGRYVLAPDLPGIGRSAPVPDGHRKCDVARHLRDELASQLAWAKSVSLVGHDLGAMVAYAWAAKWPSEIARLYLIETPIAGLPPWEEVLKLPQAWHFGFQGPFAKALVDGREDIYLERFWTEMSFDPGAIGAEDRAAYVEDNRVPGAIEASFDYFATFGADADDNRKLSGTPLAMPVLAIGGGHSMREAVGEQAKLYASDVSSIVINDAAHYPVDENLDAAFAALDDFLPCISEACNP